MKQKVEHSAKVSLILGLFIGLFLIGENVYAQENEEQNTHSLSKDSWEKAKKGIDYSNEKKLEEFEEIAPVVDKPSGPSWQIGGSIFQVIIISLVLIVLVFLIMRLIGNKGLEGKVREKDLRTYSLDELEEDFHETDLERHLRLALENEDYKAAVRIYYLSIIKELSSKGWIKWKKEKTNFDYIIEMRKKESSGSFRELTLAFEIIWYGDQSIGLNDYNRLSPVFASYLRKIESKDER